MSDTNDSWSETITRKEVADMFDINLSDSEWLDFMNQLDEAIANLFAEMRWRNDV